MNLTDDKNTLLVDGAHDCRQVVLLMQDVLTPRQLVRILGIPSESSAIEKVRHDIKALKRT